MAKKKAAAPAPKYDNSWYKDLVVYQIWCRSFKDGNGDGIGDLWGVMEELDYIQSLGCNAIWFSPIYPSPQADYGYDIADYYNINPEYGDLKLFKKLLDDAHKRGMKVFMDLVVNHSSDECVWFKEACKSRDNPYHDYYIWRDPKYDKKGNRLPPNNWISLFEGGAWKYVESVDQYYLHVFAEKQPDLNHDNPKVREEVKNVMRFWLDMGVDGFREDVITFISKREGLPNGFPLPIAAGIEHYNKGPNLMKYLHEYRAVADEYDCIQVAESPMTGAKDAVNFTVGDDKVFDMMITFDHMNADCFMTDTIHLPFSLRKLKKALSSWQENLNGRAWNCLYIENHDHPRVISRYGSEKYWKESGKALATCAYMLQGTPFVYQGQELGMLNNKLEHLEDFKDIVTFNNAKLFKQFGFSDKFYLKVANKTSRENSRTPVQWSAKKNAGFTKGTPWFSINQNYKTENRDTEKKDPDSILNYYKKLFKVRKENPVLVYGDYKEYDKKSKKLYVYERRLGDVKALVITSFSDKKETFHTPKGFDLKKGELVLQNYKDAKAKSDKCTLRPYETRVYPWK